MSNKRWNTKLPLAPIENLMKEISEMRISAAGAEEMKRVLTELTEEITGMAADMAKHAKRVTIKDVDIDFAYRKLKKK